MGMNISGAGRQLLVVSSGNSAQSRCYLVNPDVICSIQALFDQSRCYLINASVIICSIQLLLSAQSRWEGFWEFLTQIPPGFPPLTHSLIRGKLERNFFSNGQK